MHWIQRLNTLPPECHLGGTAVEVLHWAYNARLPDNAPHRHTFFEVCLVGAYGTGIFLVEGKEFSIGPGDLFIARPGIVHQIRNTGPELMELSWVSFCWPPTGDRERGARPSASATALTSEGSEATRLLRAFLESDRVLVSPSEAAGPLWRLLHQLASGDDVAGREHQMAALAQAAILAIAQEGCDAPVPAATRPAGPPELLERARPAHLAMRYMHDNLNRPLDVEEIAAHVHLSSRQLARVVRNLTGVSPMQYLETARMDRARGLLQSGTHSVKEVARLVGYPDVHHFSRAFRRHVGVAPVQYRQAPYPARNPQPGDLV